MLKSYFLSNIKFFIGNKLLFKIKANLPSLLLINPIITFFSKLIQHFICLELS